jgi:hypothetical protein
MAEPSDREIRERLERTPKLWATLREAAAEALGEYGGDVTPELVDATAVAFWRQKVGNDFATVEEFIPTEERSRIYEEEKARLSELYPEGFTEEQEMEAVIRRFKEEYPEAFRSQG